MPSSTHGSSTLSTRILTRPNRYSFESVIGRGRTGTLYRAFDEEREHRVVLKLLHPEKVDSKKGRERFEEGAERLSEIDHPNVVDVHDFGYHHGIAFLAMEWTEGITLEDYLEQHGPLPFDRFAPIAAQLLRGLAEAHDGEVVHGDLQASHVTLESADGSIRRVVINGFGFPDLEGDTGESPSERLRYAEEMGAVAPERILGKPSDQRVDLYAFGILAYRMLTGGTPFSGDEVAVFYQHVHDEPPILSSEIPEAFELPRTTVEFIHRLLAKAPSDRPRDADQALDWLKSTVQQTDVFDLTKTPVPAPGGVSSDEEPSPTQVVEARPEWTRAPRDASFPSVFEDETERLLEQLSDWGPAAWLTTAAIAAGLAVGTWLLVQELRGMNVSSSTNATTEAFSDAGTEKNETRSRQRITSALERIEAALDDDRFEAAKSLLASIQNDVKAHPELLSKAATYSTRAEVGERLERAKRYDSRKEIEKAIEAYRDVLALKSNHTLAQRRLELLTSALLLHVESNVEATVRVDGDVLGETPLTKLVPADVSSITVRRKGYRTWRTTPTAESGTRLDLAADLEPVRRGAHHRGSNSVPAAAPSLDDDSLMEMGVD